MFKHYNYSIVIKTHNVQPTKNILKIQFNVTAFYIT